MRGPVAEHVESLPGGVVQGSSDVLNTLFAELRPGDLPGLLARFPRRGADRALRTHSVGMDKSVGAIGAGSFTTNGYNGSGQKVAIVDTGSRHRAPPHSL